MHRALIIAAYLVPGAAVAQVTSEAWVKQLGTPADDYVVGAVPDGSGGVVIGGTTQGGLAAPSTGNADLFLARYDADGNQLWIRQHGTTGAEVARAVGTPGEGESLMVGMTISSFGGPWMGGTDAFLAHYDASGNEIAVIQFGTSHSDEAVGVTAAGGAAFVAGHTAGGSLGGPAAGGQDAYAARFDLTTHTVVWIRQIGTANFENAFAAAPDGAGGAVFGGNTSGSIGGPNAGGNDAYLARYDADGNQVWARQLGTPFSDSLGGLSPDGAGGVVAIGYTSGALVAPSAGGIDIFVVAYDSAGNQAWLRQLGSTAADHGIDIVHTGPQGALVTGYSFASLWGGHSGESDGVLALFDGASSTLHWGHQFGSGASDQIAAVAADGDHIYVGGRTTGSLGAPHAGGLDAFLVRVRPPCFADCNESGFLTVADFACFQTRFVAGEPYADCDGSGTLTVADFGCFQTKFVAACP